jgi:hypothetical protein
MAIIHISRLICDPGSENEFDSSNSYVFDAYEREDFDGELGDLVYFYSDIPGTQVILDLSTIGDISVSFIDFQDINFINGTVYVDNTCVWEGQNNSGIIPISVANSIYQGTVRFDESKKINLVNFLPDALQESEIYEFTLMFENFLNEISTGVNGLTIANTEVSANCNASLYSIPDHDLESAPKLSILDKINRLTELHDPDLIDINYIQYFAKYLGYDFTISRDQIGQFGTVYDSQYKSDYDSNKWLRFLVSNLPNFYKIKTTKNAIRTALYSFGLIGDIATYYTKDYSQDFKNWKLDDQDDLATIKKDWYPTPHFSALINLDKSINRSIPSGMDLLELLIKEGEGITKAIESLRPANTVFHRLGLYTSESATIWVGGNVRFNRYIRIYDLTPSDYWVH